MTVSDWIALSFGIIGAITGVLALLQTRKTNKLAKTANTLAQEAVESAGEANGLARDANEISHDANAISQRALKVSSDQTEYNWTVEFDYQTSALIVFNDSALFANDVSVIVSSEEEAIAEAVEHRVPAFGKLVLQSNLFRQKLLEDAGRYGNGFYGTPVFKVTISVVWNSELGVRKANQAKLGFSKTKRKKHIS
ncbi:MAG: hypothetical protein LKI98_04185 [Bifidobacterium crudilactis]|jgi:hypothetical protein|nr:hypothetical protein [Bifidobacterium crudilactis]MCI1889619.1 hypothetical protein [Bifidobacterium crudilactis]